MADALAIDLLPPGGAEFLAGAGWSGAMVEAIPGDASFRRYFRLRDEGRSALLMHAPPPHEDCRPFVHVARWLSANGQRAPEVLACDEEAGFVLVEDFGDRRMREWVDAHPDQEAAVYAGAIDALTILHRQGAGPFEPYDRAVYQREAALFTEWFCPAAGLPVDVAGWTAAWDAALPLVDPPGTAVTVLRDYHAENIMLLEGGGQGLIDFQDALVGHPAYDLVSLLQDARRDVSPALEEGMLHRYLAGAGVPDRSAFEAAYAVLGAQRNAKIVGIFTRLARRDGKPRYLAMIPRVWRHMERDLAHPALEPVRKWFDANIPSALRRAGGAAAQ